MHTQAQADPAIYPRRRRRAAPELSATGSATLRLLSEQAAVPLDQLPRLLGVQMRETTGALQELDRAGCIEHKRFLLTEGPWYWPSRRGARLSGTPYGYGAPDVAILAHRRAVNEIRLHLADRAPRGRWHSERAVIRRRESDAHLPDALFEIDGERHAIEAELSRKDDREIRQILTKHEDRYDAVLYFCGARTLGMMRRLAAEGRWPKLVVRPLPEVA